VVVEEEAPEVTEQSVGSWASSRWPGLADAGVQEMRITLAMMVMAKQSIGITEKLA
jgi:hypothetical protein